MAVEPNPLAKAVTHSGHWVFECVNELGKGFELVAVIILGEFLEDVPCRFLRAVTCKIY